MVQYAETASCILKSSNKKASSGGGTVIAGAVLVLGSARADRAGTTPAAAAVSLPSQTSKCPGLVSDLASSLASDGEVVKWLRIIQRTVWSEEIAWGAG
jgi:hypothetical protein